MRSAVTGSIILSLFLSSAAADASSDLLEWVKSGGAQMGSVELFKSQAGTRGLRLVDIKGRGDDDPPIPPFHGDRCAFERIGGGDHPVRGDAGGCMNNFDSGGAGPSETSPASASPSAEFEHDRNAVVLSIPAHLVVTEDAVDRSAASFAASAVKECTPRGRERDPHTPFVLFRIAEGAEPDSPWSPYLASLPKDPPPGLWPAWTRWDHGSASDAKDAEDVGVGIADAEKDFGKGVIPDVSGRAGPAASLHGYPSGRRADSLRRATEEEHRDVFGGCLCGMCSARPRPRGCDALLRASLCDAEAGPRALAVERARVATRILSVRQGGGSVARVLAPAADLVNHAACGPGLWSFDAKGEAPLRIVAAACKPGSREVFISYGSEAANDPALLFTSYGFIEPGAALDQMWARIRDSLRGADGVPGSQERRGRQGPQQETQQRQRAGQQDEQHGERLHRRGGSAGPGVNADAHTGQAQVTLSAGGSIGPSLVGDACDSDRSALILGAGGKARFPVRAGEIPDSLVLVSHMATMSCHEAHAAIATYESAFGRGSLHRGTGPRVDFFGLPPDDDDAEPRDESHRTGRSGPGEPAAARVSLGNVTQLIVAMETSMRILENSIAEGEECGTGGDRSVLPCFSSRTAYSLDHDHETRSAEQGGPFSLPVHATARDALTLANSHLPPSAVASGGLRGDDDRAVIAAVMRTFERSLVISCLDALRDAHDGILSAYCGLHKYESELPGTFDVWLCPNLKKP